MGDTTFSPSTKIPSPSSMDDSTNPSRWRLSNAIEVHSTPVKLTSGHGDDDTQADRDLIDAMNGVEPRLSRHSRAGFDTTRQPSLQQQLVLAKGEDERCSLCAVM